MSSQRSISVIDVSSFRVIYELYFDPVCEFLSFYTRDAAAIEDVVQDIFINLWENRDYVEIRYLKTYLYNAARNRMLNYLRNTENHTLSLAEWVREKEAAEAGADCYDLEEFSIILGKAVDLLPERCKEIFILNKEKKLTYQQIADYCHISVKTVETQMSIALKRIRAYITSNYGTAIQIGLCCLCLSL
ncbi:RNA polymerase sigma-70 factor [Parabacteroides sp. Marseille-P3160]|uniref:RNA polymerase sigma-70 factor n=1 Tax=Parabacteroides sp. Marseille-P3160 TaxID=1917887 RepID=UPI0009B94121|nr:RNA polymerase sigma-70 factor [Parabacteroides sp. Marseille-P3160]